MRKILTRKADFSNFFFFYSRIRRACLRACVYRHTVNNGLYLKSATKCYTELFQAAVCKNNFISLFSSLFGDFFLYTGSSQNRKSIFKSTWTAIKSREELDTLFFFCVHTGEGYISSMWTMTPLETKERFPTLHVHWKWA